MSDTMSGYGSDIDNQPLRYWNGKPIYLTVYLTLALTAGIIITVLLEAGGFPAAALAFFPQGLRHGAIWQPFTYVFVNPISFFTPLGLLAFFFWAVEVEKYLGRRRLIELCGALILGPVVLLSILSLFGSSGFLAGDYFLLAGVLVAFATLYPDMDYIGGWIPLKWFAFACIVCGSLMYFAQHQWGMLLVLWGNCAIAFALVRHSRGLLNINFDLRRFWPRKKPKLRVLPRPEPAHTVSRAAHASGPEVDDAEEEINALLDKIASTGLHSLSDAEKARLEALRLRMLRKGS